MIHMDCLLACSDSPLGTSQSSRETPEGRLTFEDAYGMAEAFGAFSMMGGGFSIFRRRMWRLMK